MTRRPLDSGGRGQARRPASIVTGFLLALAVATPPARAAADGGPSAMGESEAALPCRPTIACTAEFVSPGRFEVELGYLGRSLEGRFQHSTPALVKVTLTEAIQLQLGSNGLVAEGSHRAYLDAPLVTAKVLLVKQSGLLPALALSAGAGLAALQRTRDPSTSAQVIAYATKDLFSIHADLNLGASGLTHDGSSRTQPFAALALSRDVVRDVTAMVEGYLFTAAIPVASADHGLLAAVGLAVNPRVVLDVGVDWGMGGQDRRHSVFVGATLLGPRLWGP
jgi:hypothetical protein